MDAFFGISVAHIRKALSPSESAVPQPLQEHLLDVARMASEFAKKAGLSLSGYLVGLVHDLGKYPPLFQRYIRSAAGCLPPSHPDYVDPIKNKGRIDHSTAGAQRLWAAFAKSEAQQPMAQMLALCVFSHHSGLCDCISPDEKDIFSARILKDGKKTGFPACVQQSDASIQDALAKALNPAVLAEAAAAIQTLHNRIRQRLPHNATNEDLTDNINSRNFQQGLLARFLLSCLLDADRIDSAEFDDPAWKAIRAKRVQRPWSRLVPRFEKHLASFTPRHSIDALRNSISEQCSLRAGDDKGIFTLTVPTGGGKTLSSLRFALKHAHKHNMDRIIYIIPYTSIIDQNAEVARRILEQDEEDGSIVLEHHSNFIPQKKQRTKKNANDPEPESISGNDNTEDEGPAKEWERLAENWESPVVFTTMAQFLESLFGSGTRHARRMHNLANSVLVFDEVQTLPMRCLHMFCNAIDFLVHSCGSTAVLCTATQPRFGNVPRPQLGSLPLTPEQEIVEDMPRVFKELRRTGFFDHCKTPVSPEESAQLAQEELRLSGSCLVICNTKSVAESVYALCADTPDATLYYLSTNLCPAHRLLRLGAMRKDLEAGRPVLCVSTQLIECGVDISFGSVIRYAAGLDSILQAAGRCNRHGGPTHGRVHIVRGHDADERLGAMRDIQDGRAIFLDAIRLGLAQRLEELHYDLTSPEIIATYFDHYLYCRGPVLAYPLGQAQYHDTLLSMLGSNKRVAPLQNDIGRAQQSFASAARLFQAIDQNSQSIIVPYEDGKAIIADLCSTKLLHHKKNLLRKAQRYSVNVFSHTMKKLSDCGALYPIQDSGLFALDTRFYSLETGVATQVVSAMDNHMH